MIWQGHEATANFPLWRAGARSGARGHHVRDLHEAMIEWASVNIWFAPEVPTTPDPMNGGLRQRFPADRSRGRLRNLFICSHQRLTCQVSGIRAGPAVIGPGSFKLDRVAANLGESIVAEGLDGLGERADRTAHVIPELLHGTCSAAVPNVKPRWTATKHFHELWCRSVGVTRLSVVHCPALFCRLARIRRGPRNLRKDRPMWS